LTRKVVGVFVRFFRAASNNSYLNLKDLDFWGDYY
jgi:hypothetical protein